MPVKSKIVGKNSIFKPLIIIFAILLIIGGIYSFFGSEKKDNNEEDTQNQVKSSGIDSDKKVENVGDVEEVIAKWIEANPEAILNSVANMQKKEAEEQMKNAQKTIGSRKKEIYDDKAPSYKPSGYNTTIVAFYDYNCGYCKRSNATIEELIASDKKVRVIYRDFPILGKSSEDLSKVSIALDIVDSKKFRQFHNELMRSNASSEEEALEIAEKVGVSKDKVKKVLSSKKERIMEIINENRQLGASIGLQGTPAFVIGEELIPGAIDLNTMQEKIKASR